MLLYQKTIVMALKALYLLVLTSLVHCHQTHGCCLPEQWQVAARVSGAIAQPNGTLQIISGHVEEFWDGIGEKVRLNMSPGPITTVLMLFKQNVAYTVVNNVCRKWHPGPWQNKTVCFPKNNTSCPYRIGYRPSITVKDYSFDGNIVTIADRCVPIFAKQWIGKRTVFASVYDDFFPKIRDHRVFNVPAICKNATTGENGGPLTWQRSFVWEILQ